MSLDRLKDSFVAMVEAALDVIGKRRVDYAALYPAKVVQQAADGTLEVRPDDERLGESLTKVPIRTPAPDIVITVEAGAYVLIGFEGNSPAAPYASLWQSGAIIELKIAGGTKGAARLDDSVEVTIPSGTFVTAVAGPGVGTVTLNPAPVDVTGTITAASSKVLVG